MKKIVPFKKEIIFKTNLSEITSISLENTLKTDKESIVGNFIISGEYKATEKSVDVEPFTYEIPFSIAFDPKYILDNSTINIEDFYYEIINNKVLSINIEVLIDNIDEREAIDVEEKRCIEEEPDKETTNVFDNIDVDDSYNTYKIYIVRENDSVEKIIEKYNISKEELEEYNNLSEIKLGDKIIIPVSNEGN